ncbi:lipopolysaccharide biosynthesis protein [Mangrovibacterium sp.]|uniref:lipopolysaccharide biosynthesis protein n=1 Tax=Mangrovibacterium sp. TaxID=1961364 RepID=UPI00356873C7
MSVANRVIKNTGFLYAKMGITMFISLYTTRLVLNALGASDFGIFNVVGGAIAMLGFLHAAMSSATQRFMSFYEGNGDILKQKQIFNVSMALHFLIALIIGAILVTAGYVFFNGVLNIPNERIYAAKVIYASLIISTLFTVISVPYEAVLNAHENMLYYSIVGVIQSLLNLGVALIIVQYAGDKLVLYGMLMAGIPLIVLTAMRVYCHRKYSECVIDPKTYWQNGLMKEMTSFASWNLLGAASNMLLNYGQGIIINNFFGVIANTAQGIANQITGQLNALTTTMMKAINPVIAKNEGAGNRDGMVRATILGSKISLLLMLFIFVPIWIEMPFILKLWLKDVPLFATLFCRLLMINTIIGYSVLPVSSSLSAHGDIKKYKIVTSILNFVPLLAIYILFTSGYPVYFSYIVLGIHTVATSIVTLVFAKKNYNFPVLIFLRKIVYRPLFVLFMMLLFSYIPEFFIRNSTARLICVFMSSTVTFAVCLWTVGFDKEEKTMAIHLFKSITSKLRLFNPCKKKVYV